MASKSIGDTKVGKADSHVRSISGLSPSVRGQHSAGDGDHASFMLTEWTVIPVGANRRCSTTPKHDCTQIHAYVNVETNRYAPSVAKARGICAWSDLLHSSSCALQGTLEITALLSSYRCFIAFSFGPMALVCRITISLRIWYSVRKSSRYACIPVFCCCCIVLQVCKRVHLYVFMHRPLVLLFSIMDWGPSMGKTNGHVRWTINRTSSVLQRPCQSLINAKCC